MPKPEPNEPSVLDYLKARLKFWDHSGRIELPREPEAPKKQSVPVKAAGKAAAAVPTPVKPPVRPAITSAPRPAPAPAPVEEAVPSLPPHPWPWRSLIALILVLVGQRTFEPQASGPRHALPGLVFYLVGAAFLIWAIFAKEWTLAALPETRSTNENYKVRLIPLFGSIVLAAMTFLFSGGNLFNPLNVSLWVLSVAVFIWAFWLPGPQARKDLGYAAESGPTLSGDVLANDRSRRRRISVTAASQGRKRLSIGAPFVTAAGGSLTLNADGKYQYTPPVWDNVPAGGLAETFRYTITDSTGATSSSTLTVEVSDSDRLPAPPPSLWRRLRDFFSRRSWQFTVTRWTLLVLLVAGVVIFFRVYQINTVPFEPFSDHAEKLLDVFDVTQGKTHIFFPRNTGREAIQMYLTVVVAWLFHTGLTFLSLKIDMVICGLLTLPYLYLLGKELGGKRIGLLAVFFCGIAYWPNVISRVGLRFSLYPLFVAPTLYYLIRGLRSRNRNDFILSGFFLGVGLHGYSSFRIVPFVVVAAVVIYWLHREARGSRQNAILWLGILAIMSLYVFMPLARYWQQNPEMFGLRAFSRLGSTEQPLPGPWWQILASNTWNSLKMFNWNNGTIWVHSVPGRPAFDVVSAALFLIGVILLLVRYVRERHWQDLFLLISIPLLQLPSTLSLAFPAENPSLNRPGGAFIPAFLIVAIALDGFLTALAARKNPKAGAALVWTVALLLAGWSAFQNYDLVFNQYSTNFRKNAWNTSEMATVIRQFADAYGSVNQAWIVPYPYWVDTRLPGDWLGLPTKDFVLWPQDFAATEQIQGAKLFIVKPEDTQDADALVALYPQAVVSTFHSAVKDSGKDFLIVFVPPTR